MENIKFRQAIFLHGKFLKWHYWGCMTDGNFTGPIGVSKDAREHSQLFTGLQDTHGDDIYEGDIIHFYKKKWGFVVIYNNGMFTCQYINKVLITKFRMHDCNSNGIGYYGLPSNMMQVKGSPWSIAGNTYENPKLLEEE